MGKNRKIKTKWGSLDELDQGRWQVNWRTGTGRHRVKIEAESLEEALSLSRTVIDNPPGERQSYRTAPASCPSQAGRLRVSDCLRESAKTRRWSASAKDLDDRATTFFLTWVDAQGLSFWKEITYQIALEYQSYLKDKGLSPQTIIHYFRPIRRSARWAAANWPGRFVDFTAPMQFERPDASQYAPALTVYEVLDWMDWMVRNDYSALVPGVAVQGLCGLSVEEARRLPTEAFDRAENTLTIAGETKNRYRQRTIPVPAIVGAILRQIVAPGGSLLLPMVYADYNTYGKTLQRVWAAHQKQGGGRPGPFKSKDLRKVLPTLAAEEGWNPEVVRRFIGHAPDKIMERHYVRMSPETLIDQFRESVTGPMDRLIGKWGGIKSTALPVGPREVERIG